MRGSKGRTDQLAKENCMRWASWLQQSPTVPLGCFSRATKLPPSLLKGAAADTGRKNVDQNRWNYSFPYGEDAVFSQTGQHAEASPKGELTRHL